MKIFNTEDVENRIILCRHCGFRYFVMHVGLDVMNIMNPNHLSFCPICGKELYTLQDLRTKMMDLEYKVMHEED